VISYQEVKYKKLIYIQMIIDVIIDASCLQDGFLMDNRC